MHRAKRGPFRPISVSDDGDGIRWSTFIAVTAAMCIALFLAIFLSGGPAATTAAVGTDPHRASFGICFGPDRYTCVVDGDTIWFDGRKIRIADINTPEISSPGCASEKRLGEKAKIRLQVLLNQGSFSLERTDRDQDKYGRDLRIITRDGRSLGDTLVNEGLAERWQGFRRDWC
ncbi:thermonuclease family protein [Parasphingorhabdus sp.]|uniref:thermonuclease family protein n=1 Tax=Parasphingorhabdus sp. TaxID=2709688 RepID=UPI003C71CBEF